MGAAHIVRQGGLGIREAGWYVQRESLAHVEKGGREPDEGIWEVRSTREQFTYSKAMAWVAFDRAIKSAETWNLPAPLGRWREIRKEIHEDVCARGFDPELNSFVRAHGTQELDASLLLLPAIGFLPGDDPRICGTVAAIERRLLRDGLVYRYRPAGADDGLKGDEGGFLRCAL